MREHGGDGESDDGVPDEESDDGMFGDVAFFPGDFGMGDEGYDGGDGSGDKVREPEEIVVFDDEVGDDGKKDIVEEGNADADEEITDGVLAGFDVLGGSGTVFGFFTIIHTVYYIIWR